jgi:hypothetical protein
MISLKSGTGIFLDARWPELCWSGWIESSELAGEAVAWRYRKRVKPEIGIRAMRTKQVACDILPLRIYSLTPFRYGRIA